MEIYNKLKNFKLFFVALNHFNSQHIPQCILSPVQCIFSGKEVVSFFKLTNLFKRVKNYAKKVFSHFEKKISIDIKHENNF